MLKKIFDLYKLPLIIAVFVCVAIIALTMESNPLQIAFIVLGAFAGIFFLDLDYVLHTYFLEPASDFSKSFQGFMHHKDFNGLVNYIHYHRNELKEKTLNSAIFQLVLGGASILVVSSTASNFAKALVISAFINSMYRMAEQHFEYKDLNDWFWAFKTKPDRGGIVVYCSILVAVLVLSFSLL